MCNDDKAARAVLPMMPLPNAEQRGGHYVLCGTDVSLPYVLDSEGEGHPSCAGVRRGFRGRPHPPFYGLIRSALSDLPNSKFQNARSGRAPNKRAMNGVVMGGVEEHPSVERAKTTKSDFIISISNYQTSFDYPIRLA